MPSGARKFDSYIICGTPRTGSTLLCGLLATAGAGNPDSYFASRFMPMWSAEWRLPDRETMTAADVDSTYMAAAMAAGRGGSEIFGLRLMRENLEDMSSILDRLFPGQANDVARIAAAFGKTLFIHLSRGDKLAQAVSLVKAQQTGLWHVAPDGSELERIGPPAEPWYDYERIKLEIETLESYDAAWNPWFAEERIVPLRVVYDELARDPFATLKRICDALGVAPPSRQTVRPGVAKLSDAISEEWMRRYQEDAGLR